VINVTLLPNDLRPGWFSRLGLFAGGVFFSVLAVITAIETVRQML